MGDHPEHLVALAGADGHRAVVIANAMDEAPPDARRAGVELELTALALLHEAFVPRYQSPGHPETAAIDQVVVRYRAEGIAYRTLHDGQALLVSGPDTEIV
jgi:hypothetical protein